MVRYAIFSLSLLLATPVYGQSDAEIDEVIATTKEAIEQGRLDLAQQFIDLILEARPDDIEANFLRATIAAQQGKWPEAVLIYRAILDRHPDLLRIRLDYARALFETKEYVESDYNFRLALAKVPDDVRPNIYGFLNAITAQKRFTYSMSFAVSPDSNINTAPSISQLTLFGLTFDLDQNARQKSGVGIVVTAGSEYRQPFLDSFRLRLGGSLYRESFIGHSDFDDMIARVYAGPQYLFKDGDASLLALATERWYGDDPYSWGYGGRLEINYTLTSSIYFQAGIEYTPDWYHTSTFHNGHLLSGLISTNYTLSPTSTLTLITGVSKEHDASSDYSNIAYRIGVGYQRELPLGITAFVQPDAIFAYYTDPSAIFETTRRDKTVRLQLSFAKRDLRVWGFSPSIGYSFSRDFSNQELFAYTRHQFLIGFEKAF